MRTRYTALAAAALLMLAACGKKEEPAAPAAQAPAAAASPTAAAAPAGDAASRWINSEFQPSTLSKEQQAAELKWFVEAAAKLKAKGVNEISVVSETITTHEYESKTLAKAFSRDHRHHRQARPDPGRRRGREAADLDAVGQERSTTAGSATPT